MSRGRRYGNSIASSDRSAQAEIRAGVASAISSPRTEVMRLRAGLAAAGLYRRRLRGVTFIGVTGSCGKTTTKELIAGVLRTQLRGRNSPAQGNGLSVVAKTILRTTHRDSFCVVEVAAAEPGLVSRTALLIRPRIAVVTRIGSNHGQIYGTLEATAAEKRGLLSAATDDGVAVLNADDPHVLALGHGFHGRVITFGRSPEADMSAREVRSAWPDPLSFVLYHGNERLPVRTQLHGAHWVSSALAALSVAAVMEVPLKRAVEGLESIPPVPGRMSPVTHDGVTFVRDDVKAPLWNMDAAFDFLANARARRRIAVIGTISDYAPPASSVYPAIARRALGVSEEVLFVGPDAQRALELFDASASLHTFATYREASEHLHLHRRQGDLVLLKGSGAEDQLHRIVSAKPAY